jgi:hypothetical protein
VACRLAFIVEKIAHAPFYGSRRMTAELRKAGRQVNRKRVQRMMRLMGAGSAGPKAEDQPPLGAAPGLSLPAARPAPAASGLGLQDSRGDVGGRGEPCGFARCAWTMLTHRPQLHRANNHKTR